MAEVEAASWLDQTRDYSRQGDVLRRLSFSYTDHFADHRGALTITEQALRRYASVFDRVGLGRCLVVLGMWHFYLGEIDHAEQVSRQALEILPPSEARHRYSSLLYLAHCYRSQGKEEELQEALRKARSIEIGPLIGVSAIWLEGSLAAERGEFEAAENALSACRSWRSHHCRFTLACNPKRSRCFQLYFVTLRI